MGSNLITRQFFALSRFGAGALVFAVASWALMSSSSVAVPINYGDFSGATVTYLDVTEDTNTGDTQPLFGAPTVSGDSLDFNPVGFSANSSGGGPPDQTDGQLSFMILANSGKQIDSVSITEAGDTSLARSLAGQDDAFTSVTTNVFVDILEVNGVAINAINAQGEMTFTPSDGDYLLSTDGGGSPTYNTGWTGSFFLDFGPILAANNIPGAATKVSVNIDNTLTASSSTNSSAFIAKKDFDGVSITTNIPEPTTAMLALCGLFAIAGSRRRS